MGWGQKGKGQVSKQHIKPTRKPDTTSISKARKSSTNVSLAGHGIATEVTSSGHDNQTMLLLRWCAKGGEEQFISISLDAPQWGGRSIV
eukprot:3832187-Ditylum_brightwellii.AAC.1